MADLRNLNVTLSLDVIHCYDEGDGWGNAEPYLWAVFFKVDGGTVSFNSDTLRLDSYLTIPSSPFGTSPPFQLRIPPKAAIRASDGSQGNLGNTDVDEGDNVNIPASIGRYQTTLKPIPFTKPLLGLTQTGGLIGCIAILMEEDNTPNDAIVAGYDALQKNVASQLTTLLEGITITTPDVTEEQINAVSSKIGDAVREAVKDHVNAFEFIFGIGDMDDEIGSKVFRFTHRELQGSNPFERRFAQRWGNEGDWEIYGHITASYA